MVYSSSDDGFGLCSMRSANLSRYYVQCSASDSVDQWSDERFWEALKRRIPSDKAARLVTGPSIEKSIAPLRSFVCEPLQYGRLFLAGDAAHIVPPTGAKGLNLAVSDVHYLSEALFSWFEKTNDQLLKGYSIQALERIWKTERFSWWLTSMLHHFEGQGAFENRVRRAEFDYLCQSEAMQRSLAENYIGLPY